MRFNYSVYAIRHPSLFSRQNTLPNQQYYLSKQTFLSQHNHQNYFLELTVPQFSFKNSNLAESGSFKIDLTATWVDA